MGNNQAGPRQRTEDIVVRAQGEENLVLDRRTDTAHCLSAEASRVWAACTGRNTLAQIATAAGIDEQAAASAIDQLTELELLEVPAGVGRRKLLQRTALIGAGAATFAGITSVVGPMPWAAATAMTVVVTIVGCDDDFQTGTMRFTTRIRIDLSGFPPGNDYTVVGIFDGVHFISSKTPLITDTVDLSPGHVSPGGTGASQQGQIASSPDPDVPLPANMPMLIQINSSETGPLEFHVTFMNTCTVP